jgi:hypothetical protein
MKFSSTGSLPEALGHIRFADPRRGNPLFIRKGLRRFALPIDPILPAAMGSRTPSPIASGAFMWFTPVWKHGGTLPGKAKERKEFSAPSVVSSGAGAPEGRQEMPCISSGTNDKEGSKKGMHSATLGWKFY